MEFTLVPPTRDYRITPEIDRAADYESLVMDCCAVLADTDAEFKAAGFGQERWPVDIAYDLSTVVEQLPSAIGALRNGQAAEIDMYGQGVERLVHMNPHGGTVEMRCLSRTSWKPTPEIESADMSDLLAMLEGLAESFAESLVRASPRLIDLEPFASWRRNACP